MSGSITIIWILGTFYGANIDGFAPIQTTLLDAAHQTPGNRGREFRPQDIHGNDSLFTLSARTFINRFQPYNPSAAGFRGTVFIGRGGTGVKGPFGYFGGGGISGNGALSNEELIFHFDDPIQASSIVLGLNQIRFKPIDIIDPFRGHHDGKDGDGDHDDHGETSPKFDMPVVFLSVAGSDTYDYAIRTSQIRDAFTRTGKREGLVDFSAFDSLPPDLMIDSFKIRETNGNILVNSISNQVPEPSILLLLSAGSLPLLLKRRWRSVA